MNHDECVKNANLRLRSKMVMDEMARWREWATDETDEANIEALEALLDEIYRRKVAACEVGEGSSPPIAGGSIGV